MIDWIIGYLNRRSGYQWPHEERADWKPDPEERFVVGIGVVGVGIILALLIAVIISWAIGLPA